MSLSQQEFILLITLASAVPLLLSILVGYLFYRQNNIIKNRQLAIQDAELKSQEEERKKIAQDLHDHMGPMLSGIKLMVTSLPIDPDRHDLINKASEEIDTAISDLRSISHQLYFESLDKKAFDHSLKHLLSKFISHKDITFTYHINGIIPYNIKLQLYRICEELLSNSIKHSQGKRISLTLEGDKKIRFEYIDFGPPISTSQLDSGIGLQGIRHRINLLSGHVHAFHTSKSGSLHYSFTFQI